MASRRWLLLPSVIASLGFVRAASAGDAPPEVAALVDQLDREAAALVIEDCALACRSLGAMRRTAGRLCALDPGPPCERARARVQEASRRVEIACPSCSDAPGVVNERPAAPTPAAPEAAPPKGGGCAACAIGGPAQEGDGTRDAALATLALAAALAYRRRPRE